MTADVATLVDDLRELVGDALRVVATYEQDEYEIHYVREDVEDLVSAKDIERIHREMVLEGFSREYLEDLFGAGDLECTVFGFRETVAMHFAGPDHRGLYVAVDPGTFDPFPAFRKRCESFVE